MDFITHCYHSKVRPYRDRPDIEVKGRWHWCQPGALMLPFPTCFSSHTMLPTDVAHDNHEPGEIPRSRGRTRGDANPRYTGLHYCGSAQDWLEGGLYAGFSPPAVDAEGVPLCCDAGPPAPGGILLDGRGGVGTAVPGGPEIGGTASTHTSFTYHADGGIEDGGTSPPAGVFVYHADGGIEDGGSSPPHSPPPPPPAHGYGVQLGGDGSKPLSTTYHADGGIEMGGDGSSPLAVSEYAEGGVEVGGDGSAPLGVSEYAEGGVEVGGSGKTPFSLSLRPDGGIELGESGRTPFGVSVPPEGGVEVGGGFDLASHSLMIPYCPGDPIPNVLWFALTSPIDSFMGGRRVGTITYDPVSGHWLGKMPCFFGFSPLLIDWSDTGLGEGGILTDYQILSAAWDFATTPIGGSSTCVPFSTSTHTPFFPPSPNYPWGFYFDVTFTAAVPPP